MLIYNFGQCRLIIFSDTEASYNICTITCFNISFSSILSIFLYQQQCGFKTIYFNDIILNKNESLTNKSRYIPPTLYYTFPPCQGIKYGKLFGNFFATIETFWWYSCLGPINIVNRGKADVWSPAYSRESFAKFCASRKSPPTFFLPELENQGLLSCKPSFSIMAFEVLPFHSRRRLHGRPFSMFAILPEYVQIFLNI